MKINNLVLLCENFYPYLYGCLKYAVRQSRSRLFHKFWVNEYDLENLPAFFLFISIAYLSRFNIRSGWCFLSEFKTYSSCLDPLSLNLNPYYLFFALHLKNRCLYLFFRSCPIEEFWGEPFLISLTVFLDQMQKLWVLFF